MGHGTNGTRLGPLLPETARLLERIFDISADELPSAPELGHEEAELRERIHRARLVNPQTLDLLYGQPAGMRRADRQLGVTVHEDVRVKVSQVHELHRHSVAPDTRARLAKLVSELGTLAGWQALDAGNLHQAWRHYDQAKTAVDDAHGRTYLLHASAEQAFVLLDLGESTTAARLLGHLRHPTDRSTLVKAWLAAAHNQHAASLRAFDDALTLLPDSPSDAAGPSIALDAVHLVRWRGHALARLGNTEAIDVLANALEQLNPTFTRATTALHVDLALAYLQRNEHDGARVHARRAAETADGIGSRRQLRRLRELTALLQ